MKANSLLGQALAFLAVDKAHAYWRMDCPGVLLEGRLDPLVVPGKVSGHSHVVIGGNGFAPTMNYDSTQKSTCTTCTIKGDNSNYWIPTLYYRHQNGTYERVEVDGGVVYYQQRAHHPSNPRLKAFPKGFRMTAGNPQRRHYNGSNEHQAMTHRCLNYDGEEPVPEGSPLPPVTCPNGIRSQVYFPSCWNGKELDVPNHQSHMAYPHNYNSGRCPDSHPHPVISVFFEFVFKTEKFEDMWYGDKQPFVYSNGDDTGYGIHGDFVNGWDVPTLQRGIDMKTGLDPGCAGNPLCDGIFEYPDIYGKTCKLPPMVDEDLEGPMEQLPGCNQIKGQALDPSCPNTKTLGVVEHKIFTDVKQQLGYRYVGCGKDDDRKALTDLFEDSPSMTVEKCVKSCKRNGYPWAGLEYGSQCFCGSNLASFAQPLHNHIGNCEMECAGNSTQFCGSGARLSLYEACKPNSKCENAKYTLVGEIEETAWTEFATWQK